MGIVIKRMKTNSNLDEIWRIKDELAREVDTTSAGCARTRGNGRRNIRTADRWCEMPGNCVSLRTPNSVSAPKLQRWPSTTNHRAGIEEYQ
jgi:hypothetical protein